METRQPHLSRPRRNAAFPLLRTIGGCSGGTLKVWSGTCWSWIKVRMTGRELPPDADLGSPQLIRRENRWYLHIPSEKQFKSPGTIEKQVTTNEQTKVCSVDLNINENIAVCTVRTMDGSGWMSTRQIVLTNYGFSLSSGYATSSEEADYVAVSEAAVALAHAECHD